MPGSSAASQPAEAVADFIPPLPPEIWTNIFRHLDINCLLNIAEAMPDLKELAFRPTFLDRVVFNAETDVRTIGKFVRARRQTLVYDRWIEMVPISLYVNELHFTNTVSLSSDAILHCIRHCSHLRELYCVNCVVEPAELFHVLSLKAMYVTKLEWSVYDERCYKSKLDSRSVRLINTLESSPMLKYMYVEYVTTSGDRSDFDLVLATLLHAASSADTSGWPAETSCAKCENLP
ncbi:hypothetical protein HPB50_011499 [Hyalomma asiaticum]|uniref:Uncharacterized protein n=1 Tax=Hyalomma asiaticum TaxID=266040 RepID=A0ACB7RUK3_HYAAI|nr:hypothetical protein HPB50_011499 [Hyalomma asiaticum]